MLHCPWAQRYPISNVDSIHLKQRRLWNDNEMCKVLKILYRGTFFWNCATTVSYNGSLTRSMVLAELYSHLIQYFLGKQTINSLIVPPCNQSSDVLDSNTSRCLFPPFRVSEVTLLFVCRGDPCRISDRWIIHNPECMMLLLALNPLYWMSHVLFPGSRVKRLHLFHASLNTSTEKKWQVVLLLLCGSPLPHYHPPT